MTTDRYVHRDPILRLMMGKTMIVAIIWMIPWIERMPPMDFVDMANPPVNLKGRDGGVSDFGMLRRTGRSCSAEMV